MGTGPSEPIRLAELIAAVSLATDLGTGQPMQQGLRTCYLAMGMAREAGLPVQDLFDTYYVTLLRFLGCTSEASADAASNAGDDIALYEGLAPWFMGRTSESISWMLRHLAEGEPPITRIRALWGMFTDPKEPERTMRAHCEVGQMLAGRIGLGHSIVHALGCAFERWDGKGLPNGIAGEEIPSAARVAIVARDFEIMNRLFGAEAAKQLMSKRRGATYEPRLLQTALEHGPRLLQGIEEESIWEAVLAAEPGPQISVDETRVDSVLSALATFADLKSPYLYGHSTGVAELVEKAAIASGQAPPKLVRRAALVHDLGRVAVPSGIWNKQGALSDGEWERARLHPYYTERILVRCSPLAELAEVASSHHERLNGSGYHRGSKAPALTSGARLLAAADAFAAMTEARPHRDALTPSRAAEELNRACSEGRLDTACARAVLEAAGQSPSSGPSSWPAGLTDREVEVLQLLVTGLSNKQIARSLTLSPKTVGRHVEHIYAKLGVSTRAGAAVIAMEKGLAGQ